jgi:hypothetical protein
VITILCLNHPQTKVPNSKISNKWNTMVVANLANIIENANHVFPRCLNPLMWSSMHEDLSFPHILLYLPKTYLEDYRFFLDGAIG